MKQNLLGRLAATAMLLLSATTAMAYDFEVNGIFYNTSGNNTATVTYGGKYSYSDYSNKYSGAVTIPSEVTYGGTTYPVTSIGESAFTYCSGLTSVEVPNSVTSIGNDAFWSCSGLTTVEIPNSVTTIGSYAFYDCSGLTSVVIPNSVTSIGRSAFYGCSGLTSVVIPNSVTSIGVSAFSCCSGLESITVESGNTVYDSRDNCNAILETATNSLICGCKNTIIPNSVTTIGNDAFYGCSGLTSVEIPNSVTSIGNYAFYKCSGLKSVEIPNSVTSIVVSAFLCCSGLESITVESGNTVYDSRDNCNAILETATNSLICGCKNTIIPNSVTTIGNDAFYGCSGLTSVVIPNSVTTIGNDAFYGCSGLTSVVIPNSVTTIGNYAFYKCSGLKSVEIPNSVTTIGNQAFYGCSGLTSVVIGNSVTSIGYWAFRGCSGLTSVTSLNIIPPTLGSDVFYDVPADCVLYVPEGCVRAYQSADGWNNFGTILEIQPSGVEGISKAETAKVRCENGVIRVEGAEGARVEVYTAAGVCIYSGTDTEITVSQRGLYVVKVAGRATKLAM